MTQALLLSGGMDSISVAWWLRPALALTIDYGQLAAAAEIQAARAVCLQLEIPHEVITVDCRALGSGDMAGQPADELAPASDWWPYRNQLLITLAGMRAVSRGAEALLVGAVASDGTHQDGTPAFMAAMDQVMRVQEGGLTVRAPAIGLTTVELVRQSGIPRSLLAWAHSCHRSHVACGQCRGCNKYFEVWRELGDDVDSTA